jgi:hypothetical protein
VNKRKTISGMYGLVVVILAIWLDERGMKFASQIVVITAFALLGPVGVAIIAKALRKGSFWAALGCCAALHAVIIWRLLPSLPFSTLGVAILFGGVECLAFVIASAKVIKVYG